MRHRREFGRVFDAGSRVTSRFFTLLYAAGPAPGVRLGIVASRKLGDAVHRNRAKRLIREIFRLMDKSPELALDLVVIPRRELFDAPFSDLDRDFRALWRRALARRGQPNAR